MSCFFKFILFSLSLILSTGNASASDYNSSPNNYNNSPNNYDNSPNNYNNSPNNYENSPNKYGNKRIIRDNDGNPSGYAVPKSDGGINYFDMDGNRIGYQPAKS
jgi:hypothetical protein